MKPSVAHPPVSSADSTDLAVLQDLLEAVPAPFEPLDVSSLDGYLCGVLLQPVAIPSSRWLRFVIDSEGRDASKAANLAELISMIQLRHRELERCITQRHWFDPWVFESDDDDTPPSESVVPWVAGFALAMEQFPALMALEAAALTAPLALLYRHLDPDDLEDAEELLAEIDTLEPPSDLDEAVEDLVRATLLLADVSRPVKAPSPPRRGQHTARKAPRGRR